MRKPKQDVEEHFGDPAYFAGEFDEETGVRGEDLEQRDVSGRLRPARQRLELRDEQKSLRAQLSDWDDYGEEFDTDL